MKSHDFFRRDNGDFATVREVSEPPHDIIMGGSISSDDASAMDIQAASLPQEEEPDDQEASQEAQPTAEASGATGLSGTTGSSSGTLLGAVLPSGLLGIDDAKPDEYYQAADQIRGALSQLPEQLQQNMDQELAEWVYSTDEYLDNYYMSCEYAYQALQRTSAKLKIDGHEFNHFVQHLLETVQVVLNGLVPCLDDYIMNAHDLFVEDFVWSMDDRPAH